MGASPATRERHRGAYLGAFVPAAARRELADLAGRQERSLSGELRVAVAEHLRRNRERAER
jgi:hypothetical protein